jgi:predicted transcriptional regulator
LWKLGPSTVRQVHEATPEGDSTGYTTVLKFLQIMHHKGLVERDDSQRAHVYRPAISQDQTQRQMTDYFVDNVFDGSKSQLVMQALGAGDGTTKDELKQIKELLNELEIKND